MNARSAPNGTADRARERNLGRLLVLLMTACCWVGLVGCEDFGETPTDLESPPTDGSDDVVFQMEVLPILASSCGGTGCHRSSPPAADMNLSDAVAYSQIVGVSSSQVGSLKRVEPGDPDNSYLWIKISNPAPPSGQRMPLVGGPLPQDDIDTIRDWIAGLPTNP